MTAVFRPFCFGFRGSSTRNKFGKIYLTFHRNQSTSTEAVKDSKPWQLFGAICITRPPLITQPINEIEQRFSQLLQKLEHSLSLKSDHELRHESDLARNVISKTGEADAADMDLAAVQTALEFEDESNDELRAFNFPPSLTEDDMQSNTKSLNRALDRRLVLIVKQKIGREHHWVFPQRPIVSGETLRQTVERAAHETCGDKLKVKVLGNAPCGFYKYRYPKPVAANSPFIGAKIFFYRGQVKGTQHCVKNGEDVADHQWLLHENLDDHFHQIYAKAVSLFLISDK